MFDGVADDAVAGDVDLLSAGDGGREGDSCGGLVEDESCDVASWDYLY